MHVHVSSLVDVLPRSGSLFHLASRRSIRFFYDRFPHDVPIPGLRDTLGRKESVGRGTRSWWSGQAVDCWFGSSLVPPVSILYM